ncbi:hypothetical protein PI124_g9900 [Phytophthora idaei]|nr:hypothetical protein PI125_g12318 [Phytophthora idaei]KAG3245353.1 hypothetical protein PI124_g9900 [Phytophthora idaei]
MELCGVNLRVNDVEDHLVNKARAEANAVMNRLLRRIFGAYSSGRTQVTVADLLQTWLDDSIMAVLENYVNASLSETAFVTKNYLLNFVESRYMEFLNALGAPNQRCGRSNEWSAQMDPDRDKTRATDLAHRLCRKSGLWSVFRSSHWMMT